MKHTKGAREREKETEMEGNKEMIVECKMGEKLNIYIILRMESVYL